jgi:REP element-mobilizing transposase RayT
MVIAHHLIWTAYGTWLPNDPRGSRSRRVATRKLVDLGEHRFGGKNELPSWNVVRQFRERASERLKYDIVMFDAPSIQTVADSFHDTIRRRRYTCYACAIMPDHVHIVIRKHRDSAEAMIDNLQNDSRANLIASGIAHEGHPIWTLGGCKRFLSSPEQLRIVIRYVEDNPIRIGRPRQSWPFVITYDDWPFHKLAAQSPARRKPHDEDT